MPVNDLYGYGLYEVTDEQFDREILYSMSPPPLKKGGILRAGEGLLEAGQILAYDSTHGLWIKYDNLAAASEVQTITITGAPTGGTFTLTFDGQTTAAIAYNATAATVQTALEGLSKIGAGNVAVTGGPLPGTALTVTFQGRLANTPLPQITATGSFTGGTAPAIATATTTEGVTGGAVAAAVLAKGADSGTDFRVGNIAVNIYLRGAFKTDKLIGLDAAAKTDLSSREPVGAYNCTIIP